MTLNRFWRKLCTINRFSRKAYTQSWTREGSGEVIITQESPSTLLFAERGLWKHGPAFTNLFRWTLHSAHISLEHLRFGLAHAVFLFDLYESSKGCLTPKTAHLCKEDCYQLTICWDDGQIHLSWEISGPQKAGRIDCFYPLDARKFGP